VATSARVGDVARCLLGGIRLVNGALGLLAPGVVIRRLGDDGPNPAAVYGLRMFGIRTVVLGADLLLLRRPARDRAVRAAVLVHASDTATVLQLWRSGQLPAATARPLALISGLNTALATTAALATHPSPAVPDPTRSAR
jgi:hypothetical protein